MKVRNAKQMLLLGVLLCCLLVAAAFLRWPAPDAGVESVLPPELASAEPAPLAGAAGDPAPEHVPRQERRRPALSAYGPIDPHLHGNAERFADFDAGFGSAEPAVDDGVPSPDPDALAREEARLAAFADPTPIARGAAPDYRALGYASADDLMQSVRRAFGIASDRRVELAQVIENGRDYVTIAVAPSPRRQLDGPLRPGSEHALEPVVIAEDGALRVAVESSGDAEVDIAVGDASGREADLRRLAVSEAEDAADVPVYAGETVQIRVRGGARAGDYRLRVE
jgi:hypothetical protein